MQIFCTVVAVMWVLRVFLHPCSMNARRRRLNGVRCTMLLAAGYCRVVRAFVFGAARTSLLTSLLVALAVALLLQGKRGPSQL